MIQVLGRPNSINVQKVMWCAAELGLTVEREDIGGEFGGNDTPQYLAMNPNGRVPTLIDGDFVLWESNTIVRYLSETYGATPWFPDTVQERALASQWMDWHATALHPSQTVIFWGLIRTAPEDRDMAAIEAAVVEGGNLWAILDKHLEDRAYVLGDELTFADVSLGCAAYRWHCMDIERPNLPNLRRWWEKLAERHSYKQNVMLPLT